ncbi:N-acetylglucosamine kinase [Pseudothermotoga thermarum]|uniref:ATPase BadF/BadG/BcrA/BcrD type n=1 Tax=Pseudothermotoga thermarum DSM 5069 TaxID=688269 RepID=F7YW51_9THEM|nr:BadF/BadG/BcrA/BcrD ATPase family protein [Pseudothermotoga thermarum]AEH50540.1 ATPase BadF/BadG/BcrA/BcrD type [Pseudothermotoga thermarum DSM 5069]
MYFLGVDVGGTKTDFLLVNAYGDVLCFLKTKGANYQGVGVQKSIEILKDGLNKVLEKSNLSKDDITYTFFGFAGADNEYEIRIVKDILKELRLKNYDFDNDGRVALRSGTLDDIGILISCGTGGINYASDGKKIARIGGYSGFFGERLGSYLIAGKVASAIVRAKDGRDERTIMVDIFEKKIKEPIENIMHHEYEESGAQKLQEYVVELIKTLFEAAKQFDYVALKILGEIVQEIVKIVNAFKSNLNFPKPVKLVLEGSFFKNSDPILLKMVQSVLGDEYQLIIPKHPPVFGSVLLAFEKAGIKPNQMVLEKIVKQLEAIR